MIFLEFFLTFPLFPLPSVTLTPPYSTQKNPLKQPTPIGDTQTKNRKENQE